MPKRRNRLGLEFVLQWLGSDAGDAAFRGVARLLTPAT
jgi:hypothetical protein